MGLREIILYRARQWELPAVEEISLSGVPFPGGLRGTPLLDCVKIRILGLRKCSLDNLTGIDVLGATLERLDIGDNRLTGLAAVAALVHLVELVADGNRIPAEAIAALKPLGKTISILDVRGNPCASAPGHVERCDDALPRLRVLDGTPMAVLRVASECRKSAAPWTAPTVPPGPWLTPAAGPPTPAGTAASKEAQGDLEAAVRRFELLAKRADDELKKARDRFGLTGATSSS